MDGEVIKARKEVLVSRYTQIHKLWKDLVDISEEDWPLTHDTIEIFIYNLNKILEPKLNENWRPE